MVCYHNHQRIKEGQIFNIKNMQAFSKMSMELVDKEEKSEPVSQEEPRKPAALSQGSGNALHDDKAPDPRKAGEATDKANAEADSASVEEGNENENKPEEGSTTGDEDVI